MGLNQTQNWFKKKKRKVMLNTKYFHNNWVDKLLIFI